MRDTTIIGHVLKLKVWSRFAPLLGIVVVAAWYILDPSGQPHIVVPDRGPSFDSGPFRKIEITFLDPIKISFYTFNVLTQAAPQRFVIAQQLKSLTITNPIPAQADNGQQYRIAVELASKGVTEIIAVSIDDKSQDLRKFKGKLVNEGTELVTTRYIRKALAEFIFQWNDKVSNWILTLLFACIIWLLMFLLRMEFYHYTYSSERLENVLLHKDSTTPHALRISLDRYTTRWSNWDDRFRFFQGLGPAVGFILTVTSLVEVLHPTVRAANDVDSFLGGIHIALISTFLGLVLRLVAMEGARVNDLLLIRVESIVGSKEQRDPDSRASSGEGSELSTIAD